jgi:hypothetical protein
MEVSAGFVVGFDNDDKTIFEDQFRFIQDNGILSDGRYAHGGAQDSLYERLEAGRLRLDDPNCNIVPEQMTPHELPGYWQLLKRLYDPQASLTGISRFAISRVQARRVEISARANEGKALPTLIYGLLLLRRLVVALIKEAQPDDHRRSLSQKLLSTQSTFADIIGFAEFMNRCVTRGVSTSLPAKAPPESCACLTQVRRRAFS